MRIEWNNEDRTAIVWSLRRKELGVLLAFASTDETRTYMSALWFDEARGSIASTDGHRAVRVFGRRAEGLRPDTTPIPRKLVGLSLGACADLHRASRDRDGVDLTISFHVFGERATLQTLSYAHEPTIVEVLANSGPAFDHVIPKRRNIKEWRGVSAGLNASYLADLNLISLACAFKLKKSDGKKELVRPGVVLEPPPDDLSPWVARCASSVYETEWEAVIMPMRT